MAFQAQGAGETTDATLKSLGLLPQEQFQQQVSLMVLENQRNRLENRNQLYSTIQVEFASHDQMRQEQAQTHREQAQTHREQLQTHQEQNAQARWNTNFLGGLHKDALDQDEKDRTEIRTILSMFGYELPEE